MSKIYLTLLAMCFAAVAISQDTYVTDSTMVKFYSEAPLENIEAINTDCKSLIGTQNQSIAVIIKIIAFDFENKNMEDHFNENYMETSKYQLAKFQGKFEEKIDFSANGTTNLTAAGKMTIHGVEKDVKLTGTLKIMDHPKNKGEKKLIADTSFKVKLEDYKIKIPKMVVKNIAEEVDVTAHLEYSLKK